MMGRVLSFAVLVCLVAQHAAAQQLFDVEAYYGKREVMIPMRDRVRLLTSILVPSVPYDK